MHYSFHKMWVRNQTSSLFLFTCSVCRNSLTLSLSGASTALFKGEHFIRRMRGAAGSLWEPERGFVRSLGFACFLFPSCMSCAFPFQFTSSWVERGELGSPISRWWGEPTFSLWLAVNHPRIKSWMFEINHVCERETRRRVPSRVRLSGGREEHSYVLRWTGLYAKSLSCSSGH